MILEQRFLVDNNTLSMIGPRLRNSDLFRENVYIPETVLDEASSFPDIQNLLSNAYPTSARLLTRLKKILECHPFDDLKLINLYRNKGNADPLLVACALDASLSQEAGLWNITWTIATNDAEVRKLSEKHGVLWLSNENFIQVISSAAPQDPLLTGDT